MNRQICLVSSIYLSCFVYLFHNLFIDKQLSTTTKPSATKGFDSDNDESFDSVSPKKRMFKSLS